MTDKPTIDELRELVRTNPENHRGPQRAVTEFDSVIAEISEHKQRATDLTAELRELMAAWNDRKDDIKFREHYARVKTQRDTANKRYYNGARRANKLLGKDLIRVKGWKNPRGGEQHV